MNIIIKAIIIFITFISYNALADHPVPWQIDFQQAATPVMEKFKHFHDQLLIMCYAVSGFVLLLLLYVAIRFSKKNNPIPSKTTHNLVLEIIWTAIPVLIILVMAVPSFKILYFTDKVEKAEMTLKIVGRQWYWQYEYPDHGAIAYDSNIIPDAEIKPGQIRLLEVDNRVVLPIDTNIKLLVTSGDVIHSWAVPAFGIKTDAVPGRTNESWIRILRPGVYYGQCSELCGVNHGFMPIAVEAISKEDFAKWVDSKTKKAENIAFKNEAVR